jgi:hypothetical protein
MATKPKGTIRRIMDTIGDLVRQPMSDESNEVPTPTAVRQGKAVAKGPRSKKKKAAAKKSSAKRSTARKAKPAARKKKR